MKLVHEPSLRALTKARDWNDVRLRGERLPEHELPNEEHCDLCGRKMQPDPDTLAASGHNICPICLEDMIYAHDQR